MAMQTEGSGLDLMSTAVIATLFVTVTGHLGNPGQEHYPPRPDHRGI